MQENPYGILFGIGVLSYSYLITKTNVLMIHNEDQRIFSDLRFWIVLVCSSVLITFLILSYPT